MKLKRHFALLSVALITASMFSLTACTGNSTSAADSTSQATLYGKVTAVSGKKITLALGTVKKQSGTVKGNTAGVNSASSSTGGQQGGGTPPTMQNGGQQGGSSGGTPPQMPSGGKTGAKSTSSGKSTGAPNGGAQGGNGNQGGGTPPTAPGGTQGGAPTAGNASAFKASGKTKVITVSSSGVVKQSSGTASVSSIKVGSLLKITYQKNSDTVKTVEILGGHSPQPTGGAMGTQQSTSGTAGGTQPSGTGTGTSTVAGTAVYTRSSGSASKSGTTIKAAAKNKSAVMTSGSAKLSLTKMTIQTSGNTSSMDDSSFYGLNAGLLAKTGSSISLANSKITTTGTGANGAFAYGKGAVINLSNVSINCTASGAHGVDATYSGTVKMKNVNITTAGNGAAAAIATDRGGGTITATGGTILTTGTKSPAIYSTGKITVSNAAMKSTNSQSVVVEGKNSVTVNNCKMTTAGDSGVFIYQSMSGDATVGSGTFTMNGGSLTASKGPLFYSTNTTALIKLKNATLTAKSGILLKAGADQWGTTGSNGSDVTLTADTQKLKGRIVLDKVSTAAITLKNSSSLTGAINTANTAKSVSLTLDKSSTWNVTANSYLTSLTDASTSLSNIKSNGHTVYYNASNSANKWLGGKTVSLSGGGKLVPIK